MGESGSLANALRWIERGYYPIPVPSGLKSPVIAKWQELRIDAGTAPKFFNGAQQNIGVILGDERGTTDVDCDCPEAISAARQLLPKTKLVFGRESKPFSHYIFRCTPPATTEKYIDPLTRKSLIELRGGKKNGKTGFQTIVPPSKHPTGEQVRFEPGLDGEASDIEGSTLSRDVAWTAAAALLAGHWPAKGRHACELAFAGVLARGGWAVAEAEKLVVATYTSNSTHDPNAVTRVRNSVHDTFVKRELGSSITGFSVLAEHAGEKVAQTACNWLGIDTGALRDSRADPTRPPATESAGEHASMSPVSSNAPKYVGEPYCFHGGDIWGFRCIRHNAWFPFKVTNFEATIANERVVDDGAEETRSFNLKFVMNGCPSTIEVGAKEFRSMNWVTEKLGGMAIVYPGQAEHARTAIQHLSGEIPTIRAFGHTGWRRIGGHDFYLHARGAIGANGSRKDVQVNLEDTLPYYSLPIPPVGSERTRVIRASLAMLDIAPDRITFPALSAVYRAILGSATFSIHFDGPTGEGKSQLAALIQQHFGKRMDSEHLPASWEDTALAAVTLGFFAKDAVLVVDDFVLTGNSARQQKLHSEADRLLRSQANASGRRRVTTEGKLRSSHPPRGLIVSTGEHTPRGKSLNARMIIIPFVKGAMNWPRLTQAQIAAGNGDLAAAAAAYIEWVAARLPDVRQRMTETRLGSRRDASEKLSPHRRTPENLASLLFGLRVFLEFAREVNAITAEEYRLYLQRAELAFDEVASHEFGKHSTNDPARIFLRFIRTAILMGRAHFISPSGARPEGEAAWGWQRASDGQNAPWIPQGSHIGWLKGSDVCLDPEAAFQMAAKLAQERGEGLPGTLESIKRDLKDEGLVRIDEKRRTITIRRRFLGRDVDVLCIPLKTFENAALEPADDADNADNNPSLEGKQ